MKETLWYPLSSFKDSLKGSFKDSLKGSFKDSLNGSFVGIQRPPQRAATEGPRAFHDSEKTGLSGLGRLG